jgi:hypothetical protein
MTVRLLTTSVQPSCSQFGQRIGSGWLVLGIGLESSQTRGSIGGAPLSGSTAQEIGRLQVWTSRTTALSESDADSRSR